MTRFLFFGFLLATPAVAQLPVAPSNFPRAHSLADNFSPTAVARFHMELAAPAELLPAQGGMPTTGNFVHAVYADTDNFQPQLEYRYSTSGGFSWSAPAVLHKFQVNEKFQNLESVDQLVCEGRNVFYVFWSNRFNLNAATTSFAPYAYGSNDMGQTWQGPLELSPNLVAANPLWNAPTGELDADAAGGRLHVVFESHRISNMGGPVAGNEEAIYSSAGFDAAGNFVLLQSDVDITGFGNPTIADVDAPRIDADGDMVGIIWLDDRGRGSTIGNETYLRVSTDGGNTFAAEVDVSQLGNLGLSATFADIPHVAVSSAGNGSVYCTYQDSRNHSPTHLDNLFFMYSKDAGQTFTWTDNNGVRIMLNTDVLHEVDSVLLAADGDAVCICWFDDQSLGNAANQLYSVTDPLGGLSFQLGAALRPPVVDLSSPFGVADVQHLETIRMKGDYICIGHEVNSPEAAAMAWTCDGGTTWETRIASDGTVDVDEPSVSVTLQGDFNVIYLEDRAGGQSNTTVVTGIKCPTLQNDASANQGIKVHNAHGSIGNIAVTVFSDTLADMSGNNPLSFNNTGFDIQIVPGIVYTIGIDVAISQPAVYIGTVDSQGEVSFPGIPNFSSIIGVPIFCAVATAQANLTLGEFTDPVELR